jgi:hypothetical protein
LLIDFAAPLGDARSSICNQKMECLMFWWVLAAVILVVPVLFLAVFLWSSKDPAIDREIAKDRFRAEQEHRWLRRSGKGD